MKSVFLLFATASALSIHDTLWRSLEATDADLDVGSCSGKTGCAKHTKYSACIGAKCKWEDAGCAGRSANNKLDPVWCRCNTNGLKIGGDTWKEVTKEKPYNACNKEANCEWNSKSMACMVFRAGKCEGPSSCRSQKKRGACESAGCKWKLDSASESEEAARKHVQSKSELEKHKKNLRTTLQNHERATSQATGAKLTAEQKQQHLQSQYTKAALGAQNAEKAHKEAADARRLAEEQLAQARDKFHKETLAHAECKKKVEDAATKVAKAEVELQNADYSELKQQLDKARKAKESAQKKLEAAEEALKKAKADEAAAKKAAKEAIDAAKKAKGAAKAEADKKAAEAKKALAKAHAEELELKGEEDAEKHRAALEEENRKQLLKNEEAIAARQKAEQEAERKRQEEARQAALRAEEERAAEEEVEKLLAQLKQKREQQQALKDKHAAEEQKAKLKKIEQEKQEAEKKKAEEQRKLKEAQKKALLAAEAEHASRKALELAQRQADLARSSQIDHDLSDTCSGRKALDGKPFDDLKCRCNRFESKIASKEACENDGDADRHAACEWTGTVCAIKAQKQKSSVCKGRKENNKDDPVWCKCNADKVLISSKAACDAKAAAFDNICEWNGAECAQKPLPTPSECGDKTMPFHYESCVEVPKSPNFPPGGYVACPSANGPTCSYFCPKTNRVIPFSNKWDEMPACEEPRKCVELHTGKNCDVTSFWGNVAHYLTLGHVEKTIWEKTGGTNTGCKRFWWSDANQPCDICCEKK